MASATVSVEISIADDINVSDFPSFENAISQMQALCISIAERIDIEKDVECTLRFVSSSESALLNNTYRNKNYATNVLSFPAELPDFIESNFVGDIAICLDVVKTEAEQQHKMFAHHLLHIISHGILHLLGYDHITEESAQVMETHEKMVLAQLGIDDPYQVQ